MRPRLALALIATLAAAPAARVVDAQCCTPPYEVPPQSMNYRFEADDPLTPLSGIQAATEYAKNLWVGEFTSRGENISMQQGAGGLRIVVTTSSNVPPGDGLADRSTKTIWLASDLVGPTYSVDYLRAVLLHEIGHIQGWGQATCSGSVMSNTNPNSYRTTFSDCDKAEFRVRYGDRVDDPCAEGCAPGYSTTCLGDQQPDACGCCINYSPIMIAVDDPQIWLSDAHRGVIFQINDVGSMVRVAWPEDAGTALLFLDRNGDGVVNSGAELFGNTTRLRSGALAPHGYVALAELDTTPDGALDERDGGFADLRLWRDTNRDGVSQLDELSTLHSAGITSLSTQAVEDHRRDRWGNLFRFRAKVEIEGKTRFSYDVFPRALPIDGGQTCSVPSTRATTR